MKKTTLGEIRHNPSKKFSTGEEAVAFHRYMVCRLSRQFPHATDKSSVPVVDLHSGKVFLMSVYARIKVSDPDNDYSD